MQIKKIRKDSSENNQEKKSRSLTKKLSFLWVIIVAALIHVIIKNIGIDYSLERSAIFILWFISIFVLLILISKETAAQKDFRLSESDFSSLLHKPSKNRIYLEQKGINSTAIVTSITKTSVGGTAPLTYNYIITYWFNVGENKFTNKKRYFEEIIQNIPNLDDKVEILYDKLDPNNSIIVHEAADKVSWHKLQKKYKIKIITNNTNN